jgi:hypothetical protein
VKNLSPLASNYLMLLVKKFMIPKKVLENTFNIIFLRDLIGVVNTILIYRYEVLSATHLG